MSYQATKRHGGILHAYVKATCISERYQSEKATYDMISSKWYSGKGKTMATSVGSQKKQENSRKTSTSASLTMLKSLCESQQTEEYS